MSHIDAAEMSSWDYKKALLFFMPNGTISTDPNILSLAYPYLNMIISNRFANTLDFIPQPEIAKILIKKIIDDAKDGTLILIDGESGSGKTTFARNLCKKKHFFLFDIDDYAEELLKKHGIMMINDIHFMNKVTDDLLRNYTEEVIKKESHNGQKTVVMVGSFRNIVFRSIIAHTIGSYFKQTVSIVIHDTLEANIERIKKRHDIKDSESTLLDYAKAFASDTYNDMNKLHNIALNYYGIGFNKSIWVNHAAVHDFEFN